MTPHQTQSKILKTKNLSGLLYNLVLILGLLASAFVRFFELGYSHFYGDETKTFYLDKTIPAIKFFLSQRKGPVQFLVVWFTEKIFGGYNEFYTRLPFAIAGLLSVVVFYILINHLFNKRIALLSTLLFSFSGFSVAFSRTVQYQSFLMLFGFLSILFSYYYFSEDLYPKKRRLYLPFIALFLGLSFLTHYDAVFFAIPALGLIWLRIDIEKSILNLTSELKHVITNFLLPFLLITLPFFVPYVAGGYFHDQTQSYLERRALGASFAPNHSGYTFWVYSPNILWIVGLLLLVPFFLISLNWKHQLVLAWFLSGLITFELLFSNPGTHINNYFIPLFILIAIGVNYVYEILPSKITKNSYLALLSVCFLYIFYTACITFVPSLNKGYPWSGNVVNKKYHLFLYGFPYNRGWDQISAYFKEQSGVRGVYTNDNDTVAQYYLYGLDYTPPGVNFLPQYYVKVFDNLEFNVIDPFDLSQYTIQKEVFVDGVRSSVIYKKK